MDLSSDGKLLAVGGSKDAYQAIQIINSKTGKIIHYLLASDPSVRGIDSIDFLADNQGIIGVSTYGVDVNSDHQIDIWKWSN